MTDLQKTWDFPLRSKLRGTKPVSVKGHEIDDAFSRDPQPLTFLDLERSHRILRHRLTL
jgi:hypothetical protein